MFKNNYKHTHRTGKRNSITSKQQIFRILGVNADGITGKWSTLRNVISKHKPLVWNIQETKCIKEGRLKLSGFRVFEYIWSNQDGGGGLALGCSSKLSPVLTRTGGDQIEAFSVNIKLQKLNILCVNAYGPQNNDKNDKKDIFWEYLDEEAKLADIEGKGFILQGDLNA